jgi:hypothetical protein
MATEIEQQPTEDAQEEQHEHFEPKGAFVFVLLVLIAYAAYYAFVYYQVFIERGGA